LALLAFQPLFTESSHGDQLLAFPLFSSVLLATPSHCHVLDFSSLFIVQFFVCVGAISLPRELRWFILGVAGGKSCDTWCSPVGLLNVFQAGLEPASGSTAILLFSV
jgi:hypothetical protein